MQVIGPTFAAYHWPGTSSNIYDPLANIAAAINYARHVYGPTLGALGSGHGYAEGTGGAAPGWAWVGEKGAELVKFHGGEQVLPATLSGYAAGTANLGGYATGTAGAGAAYLKTWQTRHGTGALGPVQLNPQIDTANRVLGRDATLAAASLPASQHRYYANAAAWWRKHRDALIHERNTMGAWRAQLGASDRAISTWITAAGSSRSLAPSVARWKKQRAWQAYEIAVISHMLGPTAAQVAAAARAHPAPKPAPGPTASQVSAQGTAFLKAWQTRHGGGFGAAWGPTPVNPQIDNMTAAQKRSATLAAAPGLTAAQRKAWTATAADQKKRITALTAELGIMRSWRNLLISNDNTLTADIAAAGNNASLRGNVAGWKTQLARQKTTINTISAMLGLSAAQIAAAQKAGTLGPGGAPLPAVTHSYGGDVAGTIGATLAAALGPFTATPTLMDRGGTLKPGLSTVYNATGRPEQLIPARGGGGGTLQVEWVGGNGGDDLERWIKKNVKIRGGGDVQRAWGSRLFTPVAPLLNPRVPRSV